MLKFYSVGGYSHVGRNMTIVQYNDEFVILDMGLDLEQYIRFTQDEPFNKVNTKDLIRVGALPNIEPFNAFKGKVLAIVPSHAHLDHIGAIPFIARKFKNAKILCTRFTGAVLKGLYKNEKHILKNDIVILKNNSSYRVSNNFKIDLINVTHSVPDSSLIAVTTPDGTIVYSNDFKFDPDPLIGKPTDMEKLSKFKGAKLLVLDSLYATHKGKCPSEKEAEFLLRELLTQRSFINKAMFVTTFSSHISRLNSIVKLARKLNRKVVFLGRSLSNYSKAAIDSNLVKFADVRFFSGFRSIKEELAMIERNGPSNYLVVTTGHQGEPNAVLSKILDQKLFTFREHDAVVFSSSTIPQPVNIENKNKLLSKLHDLNLDVFDDVHVSGHAFNDDHVEMIKTVRPEILVPSHCEPHKIDAMRNIANGFDFIKNTKGLKEGDSFVLVK